MIVVGEGELNKYRLVKRIYEYFLDSATKESYEYFSKHKDLIISDLDEPGHILQIALDKIKIDGLHCEFGVYKGDSLKILSSSKNVMWHAFDSFKGSKALLSSMFCNCFIHVLHTVCTPC